MVTRFQAEDVGLVLGFVVEGEHHGEGRIPTVQPVMVLQLQSTSQLIFTFFFINNLILVVTLLKVSDWLKNNILFCIKNVGYVIVRLMSNMFQRGIWLHGL